MIKFKINIKWKIFSIFVFFSVILWFLNALNQKYVTDVAVPVTFILPENKANIAKIPKNITVTVKTFGYNIIEYQLKKNFIPTKIDLSKAQFKRLISTDTNWHYVLTNTFLDMIEMQLDADFSIQEIKPDTIYFNFTKFTTKKVKVALDASISTKEQFLIKDKFIIIPDSVTIGGPKVFLDTIDSVKTSFFKLEKLTQPTQYTANLPVIAGITISPSQVNVKINVEEFTELQFKIPIQTINVPDSVNLLLYPNYVKIFCKVGIKNYNNIKASDFEAIIDYSSIYENGESSIPPVIINHTNLIYDYFYNPEFVEYIIEKK